MAIYFRQIYVEVGVTYPFSHHFQKYLSSEATKLALITKSFETSYGSDWDVILNFSAKKNIEVIELNGPSIYKKDKDVEFTIFLPYKRFSSIEKVIHQYIESTCVVLTTLGFNSNDLAEHNNMLVDEIMKNPKMFEAEEL